MKAVSTLVWFILVLQTLPAQTPNLPLDPIAPATSEVPIKYSLPDDTPADLPQAAKPDAGAGLAGPCSNYDILQYGQTLYGQTNFGFGNDLATYCVLGAFMGPDRVYRVDLSERTAAKFILDIQENVDLNLFVLSNCQTLACAGWSVEKNTLTGIFREIVDVQLQAGTYYVVVDGPSANAYGQYSISMDCSCTPLENELSYPFAYPYFGEDFENFLPDQPVAPQSSRWEPGPGAAGDATIAIDSIGGQSAHFNNNGTSNPSDLIYRLDEKTSGRWRLSWRMRVETGKNAYYNILHARPSTSAPANSAYHVYFNSSGAGEVHVGTTAGPAEGKFTYPNGTWFNVVQVLDLDSNRADLWIDDNFVCTWQFNRGYNYQGFAQNLITLSSANFFAGPGNDYFIDHLTLWATAPGMPDDCLENGKLCIENGEIAEGPCSGMTRLFTAREWGNCYSLRDYGGTLIYRGDTYSGQLEFSDPAPDSVRFDPCVAAAYGANMPLPLYADVFAFYNDDNAPVNVTLNTGNPNAVKYFVFSCNYTAGVATNTGSGDQPPSCIKGQKNLTCNASYVPCDKLYYIVVTGPLHANYAINVTPNGQCAPDPVVIACGSTVHGSLPAGDTGGYFSTAGAAYSQGYAGRRSYTGAEKVYKFILTEPSQVHITLNSAAPAGAFLYTFLCGRDCINYTENTGSDPQAQLLTTLNAGTYYVVVDRNTTSGTANFSIALDCTPVAAATTLAAFENTFLPQGAVCPSDNTNGHQLRINAPACRFSSTDRLMFYYKNNGYAQSAPALSNLWGLPGLIKTIDLPKDDETDGMQCAFLPGDSIFLQIAPTDPGSLHHLETRLTFKPAPGANAGNTFQAGGVSYIDSIAISDFNLFAASKSDMLFGPADTSDILLLQSNMPWTVAASPGASWLRAVNPAQSAGTEVVTVKLLPRLPDEYLPRSAFLTFSTNNPQQTFQYQTFARVTQKGNCPPATSAAINATATRICAGSAVTLNAAGFPAVAGLYTYKWNTGDSSAVISPIPAAPGAAYTVTITNTNCAVTATATLQVDADPQPGDPASLGDKTMCANDAIPALQVSANKQPNTTVDWYANPAGGNPVSTGSASYTPPTALTQTFYAQNRDTLSTCVSPGRTAVALTVAPQPFIAITGKVCAQDLSNYDITLVTDGNTITASKGAVSGANGQYAVSGIPKDSSITITSGNANCYRSVAVTAPLCDCPPINPPVSGGNHLICSGEPIPTLSVSVGPGETAWWYDSNNIKIAEGSAFKPAAAGTYFAQAVNETNHCASTERTAVSWSILPAPDLAVLDDSCESSLNSYQLTVATDGAIATTPAYPVQTNNNGTFTVTSIPIGTEVTLRAAFGTGCFTELTVLRSDCPCNINPATIEGPNPVMVCTGDPLPELTASVTDPATETVDWFDVPSGGSPLPGGIGVLAFKPAVEKTYYAETRKKDAHGCKSSLRSPVAILSSTPPAVYAGPDQTICAKQLIALFGSVSGAASATWEASVAGGAFSPNDNTVSGLSYTPPGGVSSVVLTLVSSDPPGPCPAVSDALVMTIAPLPEIRTDTVFCSPDLLTYNVLCEITPGDALLQSNMGAWSVLAAGSVLFSNIPRSMDLIVTATDQASGCSNQRTVPKFSCGCVSPDAPQSKGDNSVCSDEPYPALEVQNISPGMAVDWYDVPSGGDPLASDVLQFTPVEGGTYYAETRNIISNCKSLNRTPVVLAVKPAPTADAGADQTVCPGATAVLTADGTNYTYQWSTGATSKSVTVPGTATVYTVTVTSNGCTAVDSVRISTWPPVFGAIVMSKPIDCYGHTNGALTVIASGGTFPYTVKWSNGPATPLNANLGAGMYSVIVSDGKQCRDTAVFDLAQPPLLEVIDTLIVPSDGTPDKGSITVTVSGGTPPYMYQWSENGFLMIDETQNSIDSLIPATYILIINDANGCSQTEMFFYTVPVSEKKPDAHVLVYPNPVHDKLYLQLHLPEDSDVTASVTDLLGRRVSARRQERLMDGTLDISLQALPSGYYVLHVQIKEEHRAYLICVKR